MVNVNIKTTNGGKAKAASAKRKLTSVSKARATVLANKRAANVRTGGFIGLEKKFVDATRAAAAMSATWAVLAPSAGIVSCLTAPAIGTSEEQRDGRTFTIHSIHVKGFVTTPTAESQTAPMNDIEYRIILVWDTQTNGTPIVATDVMDNGATLQVNAFRNLANSKRFIVLWDSGPMSMSRKNQMNEGAVNLFAAPQRRIPFAINKSFKKGIKVRTTGTGADVADISDNSFSLIGVTGNTALTCSFESRCRFTG